MSEQEKQRTTLADYIQRDLVTDDQVNLIMDLLKFSYLVSTKQILETSGYDTGQTYDTAYPVDYYRSIEEIYPGIKNGNFFYDYSKGFGELVNLNDLLTAKILKTFENPR